MNVVLWVLQVLLAAAFLGAGAMHAGQPRESLLPKLPWVEDVPAPMLKFIGSAELLGGLGVVLPAAVDVAPVLTPVAATGLAAVIAGAVVLHTRRREPSGVVVTGLLLVVAVLVAWGRFGPYSF